MDFCDNCENHICNNCYLRNDLQERVERLEKKVENLRGLLEESVKWVEYWDSHEPAIELARRIHKELKEGK